MTTQVKDQESKPAAFKLLPVPSHFEAKKAEEVYRVDYNGLAPQAEKWAKQHGLHPASQDQVQVALMPIDCQNTFCLPDFELFVGGQTGRGAIDDSIRLSQFIYKNLGTITSIFPTMDTHTAFQIFHPYFWVNDKGEHPVGAVDMIQLDDIENGKWKVNPAIAWSISKKKDGSPNYIAIQQHAAHYAKELTEDGKYPLMIWPYHAMLGGIGHALVSVIEEAIFFHTIARNSQMGPEIKGGNPLTENYSVLRPEVLTSTNGQVIAQKNARFIEKLLNNDMVIIPGQAKSHCVAWTIDDLLNEIMSQDPELCKKVYLLEDCTSPVVVPGIIDFTPQADDAFKRFVDAGMNSVKSTDPIEDWPGSPFA